MLRVAIMVVALLPLALAQPASPGLPERVRALAQEEAPGLLELYQHLHRHPELSLQEKETAARMAEELRRAGFEVTAGVGGHGVVGILRSGQGPTVLLRTDLDGLPVQEATGLSYASEVRARDPSGQEVSVMHACGHDLHMTVWAGAARLLSSLREHWHGTLVMIAQPAEERVLGARAMLAAGLYERWPAPDYALALHVDAALEAGKVGWTPGFCLASADTVDITVRGVGGHGAYPHGAKDPVVLASQIVLALQTIVSREVPPIEPAVITVGSIHGGTKHNIIPAEVKLQLTVRCYRDEVRELLLRAIRRVAEGQARAAGIPEELLPLVTVNEEERTPSTWNDPELVEQVVASFGDYLDAAAVVERSPEMGAEDFSHFGRARPETQAFMFRLGTVAPERLAASKRPGGPPLPTLHSAHYAPEAKPALVSGVQAMTGAVLHLLRPR